MAKFTAKMKGKEEGSGSFYAQPHSMTGEATNVNTYSGYKTGAEVLNKSNPSIAGLSKGDYAPVNPYGVGEMRGYGAATKGRKISGKMG